MRKLLLICCYLFVFSACSRTSLITDENISDFQKISNVILEDNTVELLGRNLEDISKIYAKNSKGENTPVFDLYLDFFQSNSKIGLVYKDSKNLSNLVSDNSFSSIKSKSVLNMEQGAKLLLECPPTNSVFLD